MGCTWTSLQQWTKNVSATHDMWFAEFVLQGVEETHWSRGKEWTQQSSATLEQRIHVLDECNIYNTSCSCQRAKLCSGDMDSRTKTSNNSCSYMVTDSHTKTSNNNCSYMVTERVDSNNTNMYCTSFYIFYIVCIDSSWACCGATLTLCTLFMLLV